MKKGKRISLTVAYCLALFLFLEGGLRLAFMIPSLEQRLTKNNDFSWRRLWIKSHQNNPEFLHEFDMYDPMVGWRLRPNVSEHIALGTQVLLNSNSKGLRGKTEYSYEKDPNTLRVLILGDSFAFGSEVSDDEVFSAQLSKMVPNVEFLNMAYRGYGHDQMLVSLQEEGIKYQPDVVLLGFLGMDMERNLLSFRSFAKPKFELADGQLTVTNTPVPSPEEILHRAWMRPYLFDFGLFLTNRQSAEQYLAERDAITTAILGQMVRTIEAMGAEAMFVYLPTGREIMTGQDPYAGEAFLSTFAQANGNVTYGSARPLFQEKKSQGETFKSSGHWAPLGHRTTAQAIANLLSEHGFR